MPFIDWPSNSPDLNSIKGVWQLIKIRLAKRDPRPTKKADVEQAIREEWENLTKEELLELIDSMPDRYQAVVKALGGHTAYYIYVYS